jgi:hypothetical protein
MSGGFVDVSGGVEIIGGSATITDSVEAEILSGTVGSIFTRWHSLAGKSLGS